MNFISIIREKIKAWPKEPNNDNDTYEQILKLKDATFIKALQYMITTQEPAACAMCIVAYENQGPQLNASFYLAHTDKTSDAPKNLEEYLYKVIIYALKKKEYQYNEIAQRRLMWFYQAGLIRRATEMAEQNNIFVDDVADIWLALTRGSAFLKRLLEHNVIWSREEKMWFDDLTGQLSGMRYTFNHIMPKWLHSHPKIRQFEIESGI